MTVTEINFDRLARICDQLTKLYGLVDDKSVVAGLLTEHPDWVDSSIVTAAAMRLADGY